MNLYLKYRPTTLGEIQGNDQTTQTLESMLSDTDKCPHAFLIHGPTGCGKTTIGRIIASDLGATGSDFREVDSADFRGIDTVREMRRQSQYTPLESDCRVWLVDECHKLTNDAQNALLKILEDTPSHIYFILCTTEPNKLLKTIRGRCNEFPVAPLDENQMSRLIRRVVKKEGKERLPAEVQEQIYEQSFGHPRNALQILDQVLRVSPEDRLEVAKRASAEQTESIELCRALLGKSSWKTIREILSGLKDQDPESIRRHVMGYANAVLLKSDNEKAHLILSEFFEPLYNTGSPGLTCVCYSIIKG